jgi:transcriptional regulator with XRE-family HTH domain
MRYAKDQATLYTAIGERIMLARRRAGLSQRDMGAKLGITHAALSDIERAKTRPNLDNLAVIADALGVPLSEIVVLSARRQPDSYGEDDRDGG